MLFMERDRLCRGSLVGIDKDNLFVLLRMELHKIYSVHAKECCSGGEVDVPSDEVTKNSLEAQLFVRRLVFWVDSSGLCGRRRAKPDDDKADSLGADD